MPGVMPGIRANALGIRYAKQSLAADRRLAADVGRVPGKVKVPKETVLYGRRSSERTESQFPQGYLALKVHSPSKRG